MEVAEECIPDQNRPPIPILASAKAVDPAMTDDFGLEVEHCSTPRNYTVNYKYVQMDVEALNDGYLPIFIDLWQSLPMVRSLAFGLFLQIRGSIAFRRADPKHYLPPLIPSAQDWGKKKNKGPDPSISPIAASMKLIAGAEPEAGERAKCRSEDGKRATRGAATAAGSGETDSFDELRHWTSHQRTPTERARSEAEDPHSRGFVCTFRGSIRVCSSGGLVAGASSRAEILSGLLAGRPVDRLLPSSGVSVVGLEQRRAGPSLARPPPGETGMRHRLPRTVVGASAVGGAGVGRHRVADGDESPSWAVAPLTRSGLRDESNLEEADPASRALTHPSQASSVALWSLGRRRGEHGRSLSPRGGEQTRAGQRENQPAEGVSSKKGAASPRRALHECREYLERGRRMRKCGRWDGKDAEVRRRSRVEMSKNTLAQLLGWQQATRRHPNGGFRGLPRWVPHYLPTIGGMIAKMAAVGEYLLSLPPQRGAVGGSVIALARLLARAEAQRDRSYDGREELSVGDLLLDLYCSLSLGPPAWREWRGRCGRTGNVAREYGRDGSPPTRPWAERPPQRRRQNREAMSQKGRRCRKGRMGNQSKRSRAVGPSDYAAVASPEDSVSLGLTGVRRTANAHGAADYRSPEAFSEGRRTDDPATLALRP
ncbi:hypothetical protein THAOC_35056 [Thalassiosira oceanica]|uniref:Uncharacterized protein n=1 Tax=Thalassiosira oceanica TaxID=159749 RepID=K0R1H8_THAOC|nr:hypothetical protein THAOC_35056 [Thalassiosira oceanica]|eukprot:EJK46283.1 hypothetical protein THAOC_35056 [Thalassiosira oceanica]